MPSPTSELANCEVPPELDGRMDNPQDSASSSRRRRQISLCGSGGGQRAAVALGAAALALEDLHRRDQIDIASWSTTSGSSLMTAQILIEPRAGRCPREVLRSVVGRVSQHGFAPRPPHLGFVVPAVVSTAAIFLLLRRVAQPEPVTMRALTLLVVFGWSYAALTRAFAVSFSRGLSRRERIRRREDRASGRHVECSVLDFGRLIEDGRLRFSATDVENRPNELVWLEPGTSDEPVTSLATASAGFPIVVGPRRIDGRLLADGGIRSNTALASVIGSDETPDVVLCVDASAREVPREPAMRMRGNLDHLRYAGPLIWSIFLMSATIPVWWLLPEVGWAKSAQDLLLVGLLVRGIFGMCIAVVREMIGGATTELGLVDVMLRGQHENECAEIDRRGIDVRTVEIGLTTELARSELSTSLWPLRPEANRFLLMRFYENTLNLACPTCSEVICRDCEASIEEHRGWVDRTMLDSRVKRLVRLAGSILRGIVVPRPGRWTRSVSFLGGELA